LALYNNAVEEIRFLKNQQWKIANYAILLHAAIIVISSQYIQQPLTAQDCRLLAALSIVIALGATVIFFSLEHAIRNARYQHNKIASEHFPEDVRIALAEFQKLSKKEPFITLLLVLVVWCSGLLAVWLILRNFISG
jgi:hypothetical protein